MKLLPFEGFIIPGLHFNNCSIWILNWHDNPTPFKKLAEVWVHWFDEKTVCYLSPGEAKTVFQKYHRFDEIIPANISIEETVEGINIMILRDGQDILTLNLKFLKSLKYRMINLILNHSNKERIGEKGKTETGRYYHNKPKKLIPVFIEKAELNGKPLSIANKPKRNLEIGDGKPSDIPLVNYCTHMLEE